MATGHTVELARADQGYTKDQPKQDAKTHGIELQVVKLAEAKKGFVWVLKRWGGQAQLCLGGKFPAAGQGLRATAPCAAKTAFPGIRHPHAFQGNTIADDYWKPITRSRLIHLQRVHKLKNCFLSF